MNLHWIIGTAGHIDHGKTTLVKALTGQDTDRLKEEKERGISIDLGFAHLDLPDGTRAGVVDVPGHERFIRNMLAGAHGIDLVLFTVAADDGVMPQTEEHLDIVHLLGVSRAIFVVSKADLASKDRISEVTAEIGALTAGSLLAGSPVVPISCVTGEGLDILRQLIAGQLRAGIKSEPAGYFRMPVDRAFGSPGHGLVVTGTAVAGAVRTGDKVRCLPRGEIFRVRSVEVHGAPVEAGRWGQRVALNLTGSGSDAITRGDVICDERITLACDRFDAKIEVRSSARNGIKSHQRVRVYTGTAERMGTIVLLGSQESRAANSMAPGQIGFAQIAVSAPLHALRGDHVVLRDETAQRTLAGGIVVLPEAARHRRNDPSLVPKLKSLEAGVAEEMLEVLVAESGEFALPLARLVQLMNGRDEDVRASLAASDKVHAFSLDGDTHYALERDCRQIRSSLTEILRAWHVDHPLSAGMEMEEARAGLRGRISPRVFRLLIAEFENDRALARDGSLLRLQEHRIQVPAADAALVERVMSLVSRTPLAPPDVKQLTEELAIDRRRLTELLRAMERQRLVVAVSQDLFFAREALEQARDGLVRDLADKGGITAAEFRDRYKTSRKYAVPLLEYFDRVGLTIRQGDSRRLKRPN
jgi:selenocysteine-specific elongation factor